jgi:hypothetical protein
MKNNIIIILGISVSLALTSCKEWLDVTPPSQIREEAQFNSVEGFQQALTGCYIAMTDEMLYGRALSWSTIELMAGQFEPLQPAANNDYLMENYSYTSSLAIKYIDGIWLKGYNVIANANNALKYIEIKKGILDNINYQLIKGELLTIRAFMHFDLMRLYGYGNLGSRTDVSTKFAIPYVTSLDKDMTAQLSYSQTINLLIKDLEEAIELLEIDPVTQSQPESYYAEVNIDGFYNKRQQRFNYYAANLLLARVYMWEGSSGSIAKALQLANKVIAEAESKGLVDWATSTSVTEDVIMKSEHLMSLNTQDLISRTADYFKLEIVIMNDLKVQYVSNDQMMEVYEAEGVGSTDFRFSKQFIPNTLTIGGENAYTPIKYFGTSSIDDITKDYIPLMRIPEAYYIAAECYAKQASPDVNSAITLLNTVRQKRGITTDLSGLTAGEIMDEIIKEYRKEFYCEGVMFFLYKRLGIENIPGYNQEASDKIYVLPYPATELQMGREQ